MFIGHFGAGLAAKKLTPYTSLGTLVIAAQLVDLIWPVFLLLGIERVRIDPGNTRVTPLDFEYYPWTHSLLMVVVWAAVFGGIYGILSRYRRAAWVVFGLVVSHWVLDLVVHRPDLPIVPWQAQPAAGLGLWSSVPGTLLVEFALLFAGLWLYADSTEATDRIGRIGPPVFAAGLSVIYLGNVFGPPPPSAHAVAIVGNAQWLLVAAAIWIDRHRVSGRQWM